MLGSSSSNINMSSSSFSSSIAFSIPRWHEYETKQKQPPRRYGKNAEWSALCELTHSRLHWTHRWDRCIGVGKITIASLSYTRICAGVVYLCVETRARIYVWFQCVASRNTAIVVDVVVAATNSISRSSSRSSRNQKQKYGHDSSSNSSNSNYSSENGSVSREWYVKVDAHRNTSSSNCSK